MEFALLNTAFYRSPRLRVECAKGEETVKAKLGPALAGVLVVLSLLAHAALAQQATPVAPTPRALPTTAAEVPSAWEPAWKAEVRYSKSVAEVFCMNGPARTIIQRQARSKVELSESISTYTDLHPLPSTLIRYASAYNAAYAKALAASPDVPAWAYPAHAPLEKVVEWLDQTDYPGCATGTYGK